MPSFNSQSLLRSSTKVVSSTPPTAFLPPLGRLDTVLAEGLQLALNALRARYFPKTIPIMSETQGSVFGTLNSNQEAMMGISSITIPTRPIAVCHTIHDASVPDSGYASAEEENDDDVESDSDELEILRSDPLQRAFSIRWLTGLAARSDNWINAASEDIAPDEEEMRMASLEDAIALLSLFIGNEEDEDIAITRTFRFPFGGRQNGDPFKEIQIELNDAPLSKEDHTSVGLQSWGSCILFAERLCADPSSFGLDARPDRKPLRILELGAGTGMLSIAVDQILRANKIATQIISTDYHPEVLTNLEKNVQTNCRRFSSSASSSIKVASLDWENPSFDDGMFDEPFDIILAADVVYHPCHALWIKKVVERLLKRDGGVFWIFIPIRNTGRHEGVYKTVERVFSGEDSCLRLLKHEAIEKKNGIGRLDEEGYILFKIC